MPNPIYNPVGGRLLGPTNYGEQSLTLQESPPSCRVERMEMTTWYMLNRQVYSKMDNMLQGSVEDRGRWYVEKLGKYHSQLQESAAANDIPTQLLATIILNELVDIDPKDILQDYVASSDDVRLGSGSLGMAQIQVKTALDHKLIREYSDYCHASIVARLLVIPQYSIDAAAREIRYLLNLMESAPGTPWSASFNFVPPDASDRDPLRYYRLGVIKITGNETQEDREVLLARMIASAYNGGEKFLSATDPKRTHPNSFIHGLNAAAIAHDLFELKLFRSPITLVSGPIGVCLADFSQKRHKVRAGESLSKIAQEYYKDMSLWPIIYNANQKIIGADQNKLKIGQELAIPDISRMTSVEIANAKRRANQANLPNTIFVQPPR